MGEMWIFWMVQTASLTDAGVEDGPGSCSLLLLLPSFAPSLMSALFSDTHCSCQVSTPTGNPGDPEAMLTSSHTLRSLSAQAPVIILPDTTHYRGNKLGQHAVQSRNVTS